MNDATTPSGGRAGVGGGVDVAAVCYCSQLRAVGAGGYGAPGERVAYNVMCTSSLVPVGVVTYCGLGV